MKYKDDNSISNVLCIYIHTVHIYIYCTYIYILYIYIYILYIYIYIYCTYIYICVLYIYIYIHTVHIYIYTVHIYICVLYMHIIDNLYYIKNMMFFLIYIFTILILSRPWRPSRHWWRYAESPGSPAWRCPRWWCHRGIPPRSSAALGAWRRAMDGPKRSPQWRAFV